MSKFYAIERFVTLRNEVTLKVTPCDTRKDAQLIIDNSEAPISAVSNFGGDDKQ